MFTTAAQLAQLAQTMLDAMESPDIPESTIVSESPGSIRPLCLPNDCEALVEPLKTFSDRVQAMLGPILRRAVDEIAQKQESAYYSMLHELRSTCHGQASTWRMYEDSIHSAIHRQYSGSIQQLQQRLLDEIHAAQLRHSTSSPPLSAPASDAATTTLAGHFTPAITALLQSAYDARATGALPNKGERRELARATGLSEKQVVTWVSERPSLRNSG